MDIETCDLPSPEALAQKSTSKTVAVSLRVKEDSYSYYSRLAKKYDSSPSAIMNEVINSYAVQHDRDYKFLNSNAGILYEYMEDQLSMIDKMDEKELIRKVIENCNYNTGILERDVDELVESIEKRINELKAERSEFRFDVVEEFKIDFIGTDSCLVRGSSKRHAVSGRKSISVPISDWALVAAVVATYVKKKSEITGEKNVVMSYVFFRNLEAILNDSNSRNEMIERFKKKFSGPGHLAGL